MKASETKLLPAIRQATQFNIPIYQRSYRWDDTNCAQLWTDTLRTGADRSRNAHFIGSLVYIQSGLYQISDQGQLLVIDGQQRLTTVTLMLEALARRLASSDPDEARKLRNYYLVNPEEKGNLRHKLLLRGDDRQELLDIIAGKTPPPDGTSVVGTNFAYFTEKVAKLTADQVEHLRDGLHKLVIVDVSLDRGHDNPQLVFESMNSTGKALSQTDLIRNYILMGLEPEHQTDLYEQVWHPIEVRFGTDPDGVEFNKFVRHYLTVKTGTIPRISEVYDAFKFYAGSAEVSAAGVDALVNDVSTYASYYCAMALGAETNPKLSVAFRDLRELSVDVVYPLLLKFYADYSNEILSSTDFVTAVRTVESYVFRRAVCDIPTSSLNKTFATIGKDIDEEHYLESFQAAMLRLPTYRRFPSDDEFRRHLTSRDLYNFSRRGYLLRRLENDGRKEHVAPDEYTIEHILPQNPDLSREWHESLGADWQRVQETYLHTLGNLTLTGYNSEYQDSPFAVKRDMPDKGLRFSSLRLNQGLGEVEVWNESAIAERANRISHLSTTVWVRPQLEPSVLESYMKPATRTATDTFYDLPELAPGTFNRSLCEEFASQVRALDPAVNENITKAYISYCAETYFLEIRTRAVGLSLALRIPFLALHDPQHKAHQRSSKYDMEGWEVTVRLRTTAEIPYVIGLVRQAFDWQMDSNYD